jgi:DNA-binding transcriptional LysR family regulator
VIDKLEFILARAREKHFGRAAEACGMTQPTLSAGVRRLGTQMGVLLVHRGSRFQGFTPEGQALRGGIKTVLIPEENAKDLAEISESIKKGLEIVPVSRMDEVLARAMTRKPEPIEWDETTTTAAAASEATPLEEEVSTLIAH